MRYTLRYTLKIRQMYQYTPCREKGNTNIARMLHENISRMRSLTVAGRLLLTTTGRDGHYALRYVTTMGIDTMPMPIVACDYDGQ